MHRASPVITDQAGELEAKLHFSELSAQRRRQRPGDAGVGWISCTNETRTVEPLELVRASANAPAKLDVRPGPDPEEYFRQTCK